MMKGWKWLGWNREGGKEVYSFQNSQKSWYEGKGSKLFEVFMAEKVSLLFELCVVASTELTYKTFGRNNCNHFFLWLKQFNTSQ